VELSGGTGSPKLRGASGRLGILNVSEAVSFYSSDASARNRTLPHPVGHDSGMSTPVESSTAPRASRRASSHNFPVKYRCP